MAVIFVFALKKFAATLPLPLDEVGRKVLARSVNHHIWCFPEVNTNYSTSRFT